MEPNKHQMLLLFSVFTLIIFNLQAECSQHLSISLASNYPPTLQAVSYPLSKPTPEPISAPTPSPLSQLPPLSAKTAQKTSSTMHPSNDHMRKLKESLRGNVSYKSIRHRHRHYHHRHHNHPSRPLLARNPHIKKICDSTDYPSLCLSLIAPFFNGKCDPISVLEMAIRASSQQVKLAIGSASKLSQTMPPAVASNLHHCKDNYLDALDNLQNAMDAIPIRDIGTINSMLSAAVTDFSECDDAFVGKSISHIYDYDGHLTKMVSNCLAIANMVK